MNKVILIGNLGQDPESRFMPNADNTQVTNLSIATTKRGKDKDYTEWHRVVAFGKLATIMADHLKKGEKVGIEGELRTREWEKDGIKRYSTEIIASQMEFLTPKGEKQNSAPAAKPSPQQEPEGFDDEDIPF